ncbi:acetyltransferase [Lentzea sp. NBRC 105346]|uniref:GNAT family N-acetyltransferase n=1 Tax=Lentzea sp. NBRC 105346 TaxID=3032205 RepID=UPI0024A0B0DB|nr:GNAT family N-acetyltransferase [Lentzea sp. NBRC 105346]GLZ29070.1 acetyltransferase [Lentzea sp. NBRC 105346]
MPLTVETALPFGSMAASDQPCLEADGLVLRPWRADDVPVVRAAFDCPDIQRWHVRRMDTDEEARLWIDRWQRRWTAELEASWAIVSGPVVGQIGLREVQLFDGFAALSYWVLPEHRGSGVAARAVNALTRWAFDTLGLHRLSLVHSTRNSSSCRIAQKSGFALEGTQRAAMRLADGWHDQHTHARLRTD